MTKPTNVEIKKKDEDGERRVKIKKIKGYFNKERILRGKWV